MTDTNKPITVTDALLTCPFCGAPAAWRPMEDVCDVPFGIIVEHTEDCFTTVVNWDFESLPERWNTRIAHTSEPSQPVGDDYEQYRSTLRSDIFDILRRHDVSEQCFAEVAMVTHAAAMPTPSGHSELADRLEAAMKEHKHHVSSARGFPVDFNLGKQVIAALRQTNAARSVDVT